MRGLHSSCRVFKLPVEIVKPILFCIVAVLGSSASGAEPDPKSQPQAQPGMAKVDASVFALATTDGDTKMPQLFCGSLGRELFRQSLLICAREELGLATLDASIGEIAFVSESPEAHPYRLEAIFRPIDNDPAQFSVQLKLSLPGSDGKAREWLAKPLQISMKDPLAALAERSEILSREDFVGALKELGFAPIKPDDNKTVEGKGGEEHLELVSQFAVLRRLHAKRRAEGETVENLGQLVRSYANLGHLIDYHWSAGSKAYKARSLIYAQRLISKYGMTPYSLAHRAYARALAGNQVTALEDANAAKTAQGLDSPEWLKLIIAFCEYQPLVLEETEGTQKELARYLRMRLIDPDFDDDAGLGVIENFMEITPGSFRALEVICDMRSISLARNITEGEADKTWPYAYAALAKIPDFPTSALSIAERQRRKDPKRAPAEEYRARVEISQRLRQAADRPVEPIGPSWRALAEIIDNESFVQTWRVVDTEQNMLGIPTDDSINRLYPLVEKHHLGPCIKCYSSTRETVSAAMKEVVARGDTSTAE